MRLVWWVMLPWRDTRRQSTVKLHSLYIVCGQKSIRNYSRDRDAYSCWKGPSQPNTSSDSFVRRKTNKQADFQFQFHCLRRRRGQEGYNKCRCYCVQSVRKAQCRDIICRLALKSPGPKWRIKFVMPKHLNIILPGHMATRHLNNVWTCRNCDRN